MTSMTKGTNFSMPWLSEEEAIAEAQRMSANFSSRFRYAETMMVQGDGGFLNLQGTTQVGRAIQWDGLDLVVVARYAFGRKIA